MALRDITTAQKATYGVFGLWIEQALRSDGSLFTPGKPIWSVANLDELHRDFVENPDETKDSFLAKLERQLERSSDGAVQLCAETIFLHLLITEKVGASSKLATVQRVLGLMSEPVDVPETLVPALSGGLCNPGPAYNSRRPFYLWQIIEFMRSWKRLSKSEQESLLRDPWAFKAFVYTDPVDGAHAQRHALCHYVHPEYFEIIVSGDHKRRIVAAFEDRLPEPYDDVDESIYAIRNQFQSGVTERIDFYATSEILDQWNPKGTKREGKKGRGTGGAAGGSGKLENLVPAESLKPIAALFGDAIEFAHGLGTRSWAMTADSRGSRVRLNVGPIPIVTTLSGRLEITGERKYFETRPELAPSIREWKSSRVPGAAILEVPWGDLAKIDQGVRDSCLRTVQRAAQQRTPYHRAHDQALVNELSRLLGRDLPEFSKRDEKDDLDAQLYFEPGTLEEIQRLLEDRKQMILQGPPGTGKTFLARVLGQHMAGKDGTFTRVQFHPSYAYEDFVEGIRPVGAKGFELRDGPVKRVAAAARKAPNAKHVLLIDEINRGNLAKIFGELYYLLEYRDETIELQYSDEPFSLPPNVFLIGTMNTADRSIALVDLALRRRFYFFDMYPDSEPVDKVLRAWLEENAEEFVWLADLLDIANEQIGDRHVAIGPSYFMREGLDDDVIQDVWERSVLPYLAEHFFGDEARLAKFELPLLQAQAERRLAGHEAS